MQILTPRQVESRFGRLFSRGFYTLADEGDARVQIVESCSVRGPVEWDAINRKRAGGVLTDITVDGTTLIMNLKVGSGRLNFGPTSKTAGGQGIRSVRIIDNNVHTTLVGIAGASIGVGACIPQSPGVIRTYYPNGKIRIGGSRKIEVTVVTPLMRRLLVALDDTDTKKEGATWTLALRMAKFITGKIPGAQLLQHRIVQLYPGIREKTTNCASTVISLAIPAHRVGDMEKYCESFVRKNTLSDNTAMAFYSRLVIPSTVKMVGSIAKRKRLDVEMVEKLAAQSGVNLIEITGRRGKIGSLAAIGCFDMGLEAADL